MLTLHDILLGAVLPALVAAALVVGLHGLAGRVGRVGMMIAVTAAYAAGHMALEGPGSLVGRQMTDRLLWLAGAAALMLAICCPSTVMPRQQPRVSHLAAGAGGAILTGFATGVGLLWPRLPAAWTGRVDPMAEFGFSDPLTMTPATGAAWLAAVTLTVGLVMWAAALSHRAFDPNPLASPAPRRHAVSLNIQLLALSGGTAITLILSGSQTLGQLAGVLAAGCAGGMAGRWIAARRMECAATEDQPSADSFVDSFVGSFVGTVIVGLLLLGRNYASLAWWPGGLVLAAVLVGNVLPLAADARRQPIMARRLPTLAALATVVLVGAAVLIAAIRFVTDNAQTTGYSDPESAATHLVRAPPNPPRLLNSAP